MQFLIRSPLPREECARRLTQSVEGPIGSMKVTTQGWHVLGQVADGSFSATVVGMAVAPDGRRMLASRPKLGAQLTKSDDGTAIAGDVTPRFPTKRQAFVARYVLPPMLVFVALWALVVPSERPLMIGVIVLCLGMLLAARASRGALGRHEEASQRHLLGWLSYVVEGKLADENGVS